MGVSISKFLRLGRVAAWPRPLITPNLGVAAINMSQWPRGQCQRCRKFYLQPCYEATLPWLKLLEILLAGTLPHGNFICRHMATALKLWNRHPTCQFTFISAKKCSQGIPFFPKLVPITIVNFKPVFLIIFVQLLNLYYNMCSFKCNLKVLPYEHNKHFKYRYESPDQISFINNFLKPVKLIL